MLSSHKKNGPRFSVRQFLCLIVYFFYYSSCSKEERHCLVPIVKSVRTFIQSPTLGAAQPDHHVRKEKLRCSFERLWPLFQHFIVAEQESFPSVCIAFTQQIKLLWIK